MRKKILVLGGYGAAGRRVSAALAADRDIECVIAGRDVRRAKALAQALGAEWAMADASSAASMDMALNGVFAVLNACGPAHERDYALPEQCARRGVHYVDLAPSRAYVKGIVRLDAKAQRGNCMVVAGATAAPALSSILVEALRDDFDEMLEIHSYVSVGNRHPHGRMAMRSLLRAPGMRMQIRENAQWRNAFGWTEGRRVRFPAPVGTRRLFLCDAPDLDLFPAHYGVSTTTARAGLGSSLFGYTLSLLGWCRRQGFIKDPLRLAGPLALVGRGKRGQQTAVGITISGQKAGQARERHACFVSSGQAAVDVLCSPAVALIRKWVRGETPRAGASACIGLLTFEELQAELTPHGVVLVLA